MINSNLETIFNSIGVTKKELVKIAHIDIKTLDDIIDGTQEISAEIIQLFLDAYHLKGINVSTILFDEQIGDSFDEFILDDINNPNGIDRSEYLIVFYNNDQPFYLSTNKNPYRFYCNYIKKNPAVLNGINYIEIASFEPKDSLKYKYYYWDLLKPIMNNSLKAKIPHDIVELKFARYKIDDFVSDFSLIFSDEAIETRCYTKNLATLNEILIFIYEFRENYDCNVTREGLVTIKIYGKASDISVPKDNLICSIGGGGYRLPITFNYEGKGQNKVLCEASFHIRDIEKSNDTNLFFSSKLLNSIIKILNIDIHSLDEMHEQRKVEYNIEKAEKAEQVEKNCTDNKAICILNIRSNKRKWIGIKDFCNNLKGISYYSHYIELEYMSNTVMLFRYDRNAFQNDNSDNQCYKKNSITFVFKEDENFFHEVVSMYQIPCFFEDNNYPIKVV